ncbi:MAG TPA: hypothetical protein IAB57_00485 [Candidatus Fimivivens faecavium]|nr:hypothetical protein [Candidatus Fimivivens faecavium]
MVNKQPKAAFAPKMEECFHEHKPKRAAQMQKWRSNTPRHFNIPILN